MSPRHITTPPNAPRLQALIYGLSIPVAISRMMFIISHMPPCLFTLVKFKFPSICSLLAVECCNARPITIIDRIWNSTQFLGGTLASRPFARISNCPSLSTPSGDPYYSRDVSKPNIRSIADYSINYERLTDWDKGCLDDPVRNLSNIRGYPKEKVAIIGY